MFPIISQKHILDDEFIPLLESIQVERQEHEMEEKVEQQSGRIVELKQRRAAINEKKTAAAGGMAQGRDSIDILDWLMVKFKNNFSTREVQGFRVK